MRYFFNVRTNAKLVEDTEGAEFSSDNLARAEAISVARELIGRQLLTQLPMDWSGRIEIMCDGRMTGSVGFVTAVGL